MTNEEKIKQLQQEINQLSSQLTIYWQQINALQSQLNELTNADDNTVVTKPVVKDFKATSSSDNYTLENFIGLKLIHIAGIIVLVIGLSIGVKYAIDKELISEIARIILAYLAGGILFVLAMRLKKKYQFFSAILFSGSMASLYFTTYAAFVYYHFIPPVAAFIIMAGLTVYTAISAISYNRQEIGILGMAGAYGIPFLVSANAERADLFFSYILMINLGIVFLSFKKAWRMLSYTAMIITWILFIGWAMVKYDMAHRFMAVLFMIVYYILFLINAIAFRISGKASKILPGAIQQLLINNIALYLAASYIFTDGFSEDGFVMVTGAAALFIGVLALSASFIFPEEIILQRLLSWQAIILLILFIALHWSGLMITLLWLALAVLLFSWGIISKKSWPRLASLLLIGITLGKLAIFDSSQFDTVQKIISFMVTGILLLIFSFYYQKLKVNRTQNNNSHT